MKTTNNNNNEDLPESDQRIARRYEMDQEVRRVVVKSICTRIGTFRKSVESWGSKTVHLCNDAREIGLLVLEFQEQLPGKKITIDFWRQFEGMFVDQFGHQIGLDQLQMCVRMAVKYPEPITDQQIASSYRQELFIAGGFELDQETSHGVPRDVNHYNNIFDASSAYIKRLNTSFKNLAENPNFGPVGNWPEDRKERTRIQLAPVKKALDDLWNELTGNVF